jgi:hypothetical protein
MPDASPSRPPPRVIRVPPPEGRLIWIGLIVGLPILAQGGALALAIAVGGVAGLIIAPSGLLIAIFLIWVLNSANNDYRKAREKFVATLGDGETDPLAAAVARIWKRPLEFPKPEKIRQALRPHVAPDDSRAHLVCLGLLDVPEIEDVFFEPEIITPTRAIGRQLWFVPIALAVIVLFALQLLGIMPRRMINLGAFSYVLMMGISAGVIWVWRSAIRPTYIRMAPGVIQILQYHYGRGKPKIHSYPLEAGTLVVLRGHVLNRKQDRLGLLLSRDGMGDTVEFWRMAKRDEVIQRTWQALLSTAPTPPLSDEELIG